MLTSKHSHELFEELPLHQLLDQKIETMTEQELRGLAKVLDKRVKAPGEKRSARTKQSKAIKQETRQISFEGLV